MTAHALNISPMKYLPTMNRKKTVLAALLAAVLLPGGLCAREKAGTARIEIDVERQKGEIDRNIYGNSVDGKEIGKGGKADGHRALLALETQHFSDSPNRPEFPSTVLGSGEEYRHVCL